MKRELDSQGGAESEPFWSRAEGLDPDGSTIERAMTLALLVGIGLRVVIYLMRLPIWTDEAKLATSFLDRSFVGLLDPLEYGQVATVPFVALQKAVVAVLGVSEYSLRFVSIVAGVASLFLMRRLARRLVGGTAALAAVALLAVSYYPVRHSAEVKQYAVDLAVALCVLLVSVEWLHRRDPRWLFGLALVIAPSVALSYPVTFTACGAVLAVAIPAWNDPRRANRWALLAAFLSLGGALAATYLLFVRDHLAARVAADLPWVGGFPASYAPWDLVLWLLQGHTGRMVAYPFGGDNGGSVLTAALCVCGLLALWRSRQRSLFPFLLLVLPFGGGALAALLGIYPYGGSGRIAQHLAPAICIFAGVGVAWLTRVRWTPERRIRALRRFVMFFGGLFLVAAILHPYRDPEDHVARQFARWFWSVEPRHATVVSAWDDLGIEWARPTREWFAGGPGYRINQRMYAPEIDVETLADVPRSRPLAVVFMESSLAQRQEELGGWLDEMGRTWELERRARYELAPFYEEHGHEDAVIVLRFRALLGDEP